MSGRALRIRRLLKRHGEQITRQIRSVGARGGTSGHATMTFSSTTTVYGYIGRPLTRNVETRTGQITETTREFITQDTLLRGDRLVLQDGTYEVTTKPTDIRYKSELIARKMIITRLEFV